MGILKSAQLKSSLVSERQVMKDLITGGKKNKNIQINVFIIALIICALGTTQKQKVTLALGYVNRSYPGTQGTDTALLLQ